MNFFIDHEANDLRARKLRVLASFWVLKVFSSTTLLLSEFSDTRWRLSRVFPSYTITQKGTNICMFQGSCHYGRRHCFLSKFSNLYWPNKQGRRGTWRRDRVSGAIVSCVSRNLRLILPSTLQRWQWQLWTCLSYQSSQQRYTSKCTMDPNF